MEENKLFKVPDLIIIFISILLMGVGVAMIYSASFAEAKKDEFFYGQLYFVIMSIPLILVLSFLNVELFKKYNSFFIIVCIIMLILAYVPGISEPYNDAKRWINLGVFVFQPSELTKIGVIVYISAIITKKTKKDKNLGWKFIPPFIVLIIIFFLIALEPDFSTAFLIILLGILIFFVSGVKLSRLIMIFLLMLPSLYLLIITTQFRLERILIYLGLKEDPFGMGYHIKKLKITFASGGFFGNGIGNGVEKIRLPEPNTDSIFAVYAEEIGFIGCFIILGLFSILVYRGMKIAFMLDNKFYQLVAFGISSLIACQTLFNVAVVTGLVPIAGLPLPFLSYGGSSLLSIAIGIGILLSISKHVNNNPVNNLNKEKENGFTS